MTEISGSTIWITGASSGIGEALTKQLNVRGAKLIISARREEELLRVKQECEFPDAIEILPMDLSDKDSIEQAWEKIRSQKTSIDILINNAGISQRLDALKTDEQTERKIMEVNYFSPVRLSKLVLPGMITRGAGHIVLISSLVGKFGTSKRSSYAASKHALHGYFESLRAENWQNNIHVTLVCPGYIHTNISVNAMASGGEKYGVMDQNQLQGKTPESCAKAIIRAIENNRREILFGGKELIAVYLKRFFPNLLWKVVKKLSIK